MRQKTCQKKNRWLFLSWKLPTACQTSFKPRNYWCLKHACSLTQPTVQELQVLGKDDAFSAFFGKGKVFCAAYQIDAAMEDSNESSPVRKPKRIQKISSNLKSFLVDSAAGKSEGNTSLTPQAEIKSLF